MVTPFDRLEAKRNVVAPREITGTVKTVNEALFTCTVTYPRTRGKRPDDHGVSLKVTGGDLFGVYVIPAVGSTVRLLRKGAGQGYFVADCNQPAKLVIWSQAVAGAGFKTVIDFQLGVAQVNDGEFHLPRWEKLMEKYNRHTHANAAGTTTMPIPALDESVKCPSVKVD